MEIKSGSSYTPSHQCSVDERWNLEKQSWFGIKASVYNEDSYLVWFQYTFINDLELKLQYLST
jgi:hypothetical protein